MQEPIEIPNKSSFKINEVCALTGVKSYVLRFWESEFTEIAPIVSSVGLKLYEHKDIEAILLIKKLLFDDKLTIEKAKFEMKILMPKEHLVEKSFSDFAEDGYSDHVHTELVEANQVQYSQSKRVLVESDFQKLMLAKNKLSEILNLTETLHQKNHWN
jgi:DNA-binding transcriptional MerR regulator